MSELNNLAKNLRKTQTPQEKALWNILRNRQFLNLKFKRQVPFGKYIVDFFCEEIGLIIELDGGQHNQIDNILYDSKRTNYIKNMGYTVIRFWNNEIDENIEGVYQKLKEVIEKII